MPPFDLPGNQTQSGVRSRSTPGGTTDNGNEIRFEDAIGRRGAVHPGRANADDARRRATSPSPSAATGRYRSPGHEVVSVLGGPHHQRHARRRHHGRRCLDARRSPALGPSRSPGSENVQRDRGRDRHVQREPDGRGHRQRIGAGHRQREPQRRRKRRRVDRRALLGLVRGRLHHEARRAITTVIVGGPTRHGVRVRCTSRGRAGSTRRRLSTASRSRASRSRAGRASSRWRPTASPSRARPSTWSPRTPRSRATR